ncbi:unnamed protein product [Rotaria sordida]|uniref:ABC transporter domain-containing protein n=1 Tax=Rotaria sordida TaxID=392033 RepID=A0A813NIV6_9BILA|nr:unnamed protein product [Rotaria sordida]CAF1072510.1 unnamed protein product [Rotaria sordida]
MFFYHLQLLIKKSARYAWRRRICRCCPKIIFELFIPIICILLLCLLRWIHTSSSKTNNQVPLSNDTIPTRIHVPSSSIVSQEKSMKILNYTSVFRCPSSDISIEIVSNNSFNRFKRLCRRSNFILSSFQQFNEHLLFNDSLKTHSISYHCQYNKHLCQNTSLLNNNKDSLEIQHPSSYLCSHLNIQESSQLLKGYLAIESLLYRPIKKHQLTIFTWPCSSYAFDPLFAFAPRFILIIILILIDGCILFSFNFLFQELIDEKHQGITELLRLLSIRPLLNSFAWFLRVFIIQLIIDIFLILILKISFDGGIYFTYVSIWFIIPTILLWSIQVLSRSILVAHFFNSILKASLWSWFIYFISFWLAISSSVQLPMILHLIASAWLPFYSIKRVFIIFIQINTDLGRRTYLMNEIIFIWLSMIIGILIMWFLAFYLEQIRPGKYGISRSWLWPLDYIRNKKIKKQNRRDSINMNMIEIPSSSNNEITVQINNLTKSYGRYNTEQQIAVDDISFKLENSTIYGLIGHNGAGKTTTMEMICGLLSCDCGTIEIHDKNLFENLNELQSCIGYCPQQDMLFSYLTVQEQLEFYAHVRSNNNQIDYKQIDELLAMMNMNKYNQQLCHTLSGGMQRKLSILCAFVGPVNIIVLDEPSSSLDPIARRILWSWLREHKTNRTLLISSHLLDEVEELCDSIIILDSGKIRAQGTILDLKQQYGPSNDRLYLNIIPSYIQKEWIIDENNHYIQIPNRKQLILLLENLEKDNIQYSLVNVTLDDIFIKLTSSSESFSQDDNIIKSQIDTLFSSRTSTQSTHLWFQQILAVLIRRGQILLRRARLLPLVIFLYLIYALSPLYMPSFASSSERIRYIISSSPEFINKLNLNKFENKLAPTFNSSQEFQQYLLELPTWSANQHHQRKLIGLRIISSDYLECYVPSPALSNIISTCIPIFSLFSNRSISPLQLIGKEQKSSLFPSSTSSMFQHDIAFFCFYTLPPKLHLSIILISLILIISAALVIQDYASGLYSYSLVHGLHSSIHWSITFLSDFILCLLWLLILILIERFVHSSTFNGKFFALTPLFFIVNLPFIYLIAKFFKAPILGATVIIFILQIAHILNTFKVLIELFRGYRIFTILIHILRWLLLLIFPNVNVFTLIVAILRKSSCPFDNLPLDKQGEEFSHERYPYKILIHTIIFIIQFILYFILLIIFDISKLRWIRGKIKGEINHEEEDNDVQNERHRIVSMTNEEKQHEALVVDNLSKHYHNSYIPAVNRLTFAVPHRQCFGLLGFNGSGKTTTFRMLVGELRPTGGYIYKNKNTSIGYCPQNDINFSALTVLQSIDYICRLHGLNPSLLNNIILSQFQLEKYRHRLVSHLSGGTCRRLHLALCLIGSPTLLLLDEPTAKIDPLLRSHIRLILQNRPIDTSIIFASHSMVECEQLCDRLTILVRGNARCLGSPEHLKNKYSANYRIRLTLLQSSFQIPSLERIDNTNEYIYPKGSLAYLFKLLEQLVEQNIIASNYTVELTSLEHIFLTFQHSQDIIV